MAKATRPGSAHLKEEFDALSLDDKATFLVRATFSTAASTIDEIGRRLSELVDALAAEVEEDDEAETADVAPGATAPPKQTDATGPKKSTGTKRKTTTKKKPPRSDTGTESNQ